MTLALTNAGNGNGTSIAPVAHASVASSPTLTLNEVWEMAGYIAESKLFPVKTAPEAFALMMLCQADGLHPMIALRRYDITTFGGVSRPTMKTAAKQALFQEDGGRIKVIEWTDRRAAAYFSHPTLQPEPVEFAYTMKDAVDAGDCDRNKLYKTRPKAMLWAAMVRTALKVIAPGIELGILTTEEAEEIASAEAPAALHAEAQRVSDRAIAEADAPVPGWDPARPDTRAYHEVATDAIAAAAVPGLSRLDVHKYLVVRAANLGHFTGTLPQSMRPAIEALTRVYAGHRQWVRSELAAYLEGEAEKARLRADAARAQADPDVAAAADVDADETETEAGGDAEPGSNG